MNARSGRDSTRRPSRRPTLALAGLLSLIVVGGLSARALSGALGRDRSSPGAHKPAVSPTSVRQGHETSDMPAGPAALAIVGLLLLIAVGALVAWALGATFEHRRPPETPSAFERAAASPALPRLEVDGRADRVAIDLRAQARLSGYGWTDRQAGLARIPIARAMALQAQAGWPDADAGPANPAPGARGGTP